MSPPWPDVPTQLETIKFTYKAVFVLHSTSIYLSVFCFFFPLPFSPEVKVTLVTDRGQGGA